LLVVADVLRRDALGGFPWDVILDLYPVDNARAGSVCLSGLGVRVVWGWLLHVGYLVAVAPLELAKDALGVLFPILLRQVVDDPDLLL
jgi:hypothetical protein